MSCILASVLYTGKREPPPVELERYVQMVENIKNYAQNERMQDISRAVDALMAKSSLRSNSSLMARTIGQNPIDPTKASASGASNFNDTE